MTVSQKFRNVALATSMMCGIAIGSAQAATLSVGSGWEAFSFGGVGSGWSDTFSFVIAAPSYLRVVDAYLSGDQFAVTINSSPFSIYTSTPGSTGDQTNNDYDAAFASSTWSKLGLLLSPGSYTISGSVIQSPYGGGGGAISLVSSDVPTVPVPGPEAGAGLAGLAMAGIGAFVVRRRRQSEKLAA